MRSVSKISVVVPVYGCNASLRELCKRLNTVLSSLVENFEVVLVNDSSPDVSWETMQVLSEENKRIKSIDLSRGFGQHRAIMAGLDHVTGDWVVVMDCDLQDSPEAILALYAHAQKGYDAVLVRRSHRQGSWGRALLSRLFYFVFTKIVGMPTDSAIANFGIYSKKVIEGVKRLREQTSFFPLYVNWCGFKKGFISVEHEARVVGKSGYNFKKLFYLGLDIIIAYSDKPLRFSIQYGLLVSFFSLLVGILMIIKKIVWGVTISGWTSLIVSLFFLFGLLFANLGVLGLYLGKIFDEVKQRPLYLIREKINF